jgi:hypothetical protein
MQFHPGLRIYATLIGRSFVYLKDFFVRLNPNPSHTAPMTSLGFQPLHHTSYYDTWFFTRSLTHFPSSGTRRISYTLSWALRLDLMRYLSHLAGMWTSSLDGGLCLVFSG